MPPPGAGRSAARPARARPRRTAAAAEARPERARASSRAQAVARRSDSRPTPRAAGAAPPRPAPSALCGRSGCTRAGGVSGARCTRQCRRAGSPAPREEGEGGHARRASRARARRRRRRRGARLAVDERRLDARRRLAVRALRVELARDRLAMEKQRISTLFSWRARRPSARARARASASASSASRCAISLASSLLVVSIVRRVGDNTEAGWICFGGKSFTRDAPIQAHFHSPPFAQQTRGSSTSCA